MGIALPKELADVAAKVGVKWPQADETAMHTAAQAWRDAAARITTLAKDADTTAGEALGAMTGGAADAARKYWDKFVHAENGHFTAAVKGCLDAADRLDKAADSIGAAKVQIVSKLKTAAQHTDLSDTVGGVSKAADPTVLSGAGADIHGILGTLTDAVNLKGQSVLPTDDHGSTGGDGKESGMPKGGLLGLAGDLPVVDGLQPKPSDGTQPAGTTPAGGKNVVWDPKLGQFVDMTTHQVVNPATVDNSAEVTGPVPKHVVDAAGGAGAPRPLLHDPEPPTGPIPVQQHGGSGGSGGGGYSASSGGGGGGGVYNPPAYSDPSPPTGPVHVPPEVHAPQGTSVQAAAAPVVSAPPPPVAAAAPLPSPVEAAGGSSPYQQQGSYWSSPGADAPAQPGAAVSSGQAPAPVARVQPGMPAPGQPAGIQAGPGQPGAGAGTSAGAGSQVGAVVSGGGQSGTPGGQPGAAGGQGVVAGGQSGVVAGGQPGSAGGQSSAAQPGGRPGSADGQVVAAQPDQQSKQAPAPASSAVMGRHAKPVVRPEDSPALFLAYLFPIGHMPVPTSRPARQLPVPPEELDYAAGLRFPPHDHPDSVLIDDREVARSVARVELPEPRSADDVPELVEEHDPLGGEHERDWDRRFLVRQGDEHTRTEYSWPPGELFPEGGCAEGEAVILDPGTLIDRFGSAEGRVFAPDATPFPQRSLPPGQLEAGYQRYRVLGRLPVWQTISAPWFGQPGGGVRYRAVYPAADLIALGYLEVVA